MQGNSRRGSVCIAPNCESGHGCTFYLAKLSQQSAQACLIRPHLPPAKQLLCTHTCGWCPDSTEGVSSTSSSPRIQNGSPKWRPIDRVHWSNFTYNFFVETYKKKSRPVIIEGWLDQHPNFAAWSLGRLGRECGDRTVHSVQRRAAALEMIISMVAEGGPLVEHILDLYLLAKVGSSITHS